MIDFSSPASAGSIGRRMSRYEAQGVSREYNQAFELVRSPTRTTIDPEATQKRAIRDFCKIFLEKRVIFQKKNNFILASNPPVTAVLFDTSTIVHRK